MDPYPSVVCKHMKTFYDSLSEKDRRRYAAVEAEKLGHGGVEYVASVLGCAEKTVNWGQSPVFVRLSRPADGQRAKPTPEERLELAEEAVTAQRSASMRVQPKPRQRLLVEHLHQGLFPVASPQSLLPTVQL